MGSIIRSIATVALACAMALSLGGCKDSDKLTEIIYEQDSEIIDYDNETKMLVQDVTAEETTDQLPLVEQTEESDNNQTESDPNEGEDEEEQEAPEEDLSQQTAQEYATTGGGTTVVEGGAGEGTEEEDGAGDESDGEEDSGGGDVEDSEEPDGETGEDNETGGTTGARAGGTTTYYNTTGTYEDPPTGVDYVAAVGEAATIVSMLAGDAGALLYTDAQWASRDNIQEVLGDKYNDDVVIAWSEDGDNYDLSDGMLEAMLADEELEAVFITSGESTITEDQQAQFEEAGIIVQVLPALTTASNIVDAVEYIGKVFAEGHNANTDAQVLAEEYVDFHDSILKTAASLADTSTNDANGAPVTSGDVDMYTIYVSDWADNVTYVGTNYIAGGLDTSNGIGITELGYQWSPLAYYMSVGGAINTSSQSNETSGTSLVWQFNNNHVTAYESDFSRGALVSSYQKSSGSTGYRWTYLMTSDNQGVGTTNFPYVVVASQDIQTKMLADKNSEANSLYKIYGVQQMSNGSGTITYVGPLATDASKAPLYSVAGLTSRQTATQNYNDLMANWDGIDYGIVANPCGLFESWTDGTVESVLETAWISYLYRGGEDPSQTIYDFYKLFYDYSLTDEEIQTILAGAVE